MQVFLERLLYFWGGITLAGLIIALLFWAIKIVIYVAFVSLFVAIVITAFYHFYWVNKN
tara:strand:- start:1672 stop:1848 length:177 start_codon:yes stop_codon:yes gene_type:complete